MTGVQTASAGRRGSITGASYAAPLLDRPTGTRATSTRPAGTRITGTRPAVEPRIRSEPPVAGRHGYGYGRGHRHRHSYSTILTIFPGTTMTFFGAAPPKFS